ncbi:hypothetical protein [Magnetovibrio sp.]|uniref:hypothetical protein n=1 Tax=Magnetovibrio sp. TaxID=2024836 RepID=UPI002F949F08
MPTVQPPPPSPPPTAPSTGPAVAVAVKAPETVSQLRPGQTLQATQVVQPTQATQPAQATQPTTHMTPPTAPAPTQSLPANQVQVQTTLGPVTLQTTLSIPKGAVLTLMLSRLTPQPQFLITEINGKPVPGTQVAQAALQNAGASALAGQRTDTPSLNEGARIGATLLRPASVPVTNAPQSPAQASGQTLLQTPTQVGAPPQPAVSPSSPVSTAQTAVSSLPNAPAPTTSVGTPAGTPGTAQAAPPLTAQSVQMPSGTRFTVTVVRIEPPGVALNTATSGSSGGLAAGSTIGGTVTGTTAQGQPIVQTPHATLALDTTAKIGEGMRVVLKLETAPTLPDTTDTAKLGRTGPLESLAQAKAWPQLDEALKTLAHADPTRFQHLANTILPQPGAKLSTQMLFFLSALKGGDIKAWLGDSVTRVIERDRPGLTGRLGSDFQIMSKLADEPQSGDWRLALIPLWNSGALEQLRMYYRNRGGQDDDDGEDDGTRFVLDVALSNIGHVQIDGLMKPSAKKLDLIVRTEEPFPDTWRTDIADIFVAAQDITGIGGSLAFQAAPGNFIEFPAIETPSPQRGLFV